MANRIQQMADRKQQRKYQQRSIMVGRPKRQEQTSSLSKGGTRQAAYRRKRAR